MRLRICGVLAACLLAVNAGAEIIAADDAVRERPRVGLVLGGGGARGAAHIGVLKELERLRVPVDVVVGTSMGAIVGGLYAAGMSPAELEELVSTLDWSDALRDRPDREDLTFRRKQDDERYPINFDLGLRDGDFQLPQGVIPGHKLDLILRELTLDVAGVQHFDDLPIPFRAIASDIVRGEPYVMESGDLAAAIRASMSVPGIFAPTEVDGRLLVDGGLVGNLGVSVIQEMDVDVIIAVDVEFPLYEIHELDSSLTISEQMLTILIRKETLRQIERLDDDDILIRPDLGTFASTDFAGIVGALEPGVVAARAQADRLAELAVSEADYRRYQAAREANEPVRGTIDFVRIVNNSQVSSELLERRITLAAGDPIDTERFAHEANRLYGLELFEQVAYRLVSEDGRTGVEFEANEKSWGPNFLKFGLSLEDDFEGSTAFNLATRVRRPAVNALGAEWRSELQLGTRPRLFTEFYQPLSYSPRVFVAPNLDLGQRNVNAFAVDDNVGRYRLSEATLSLDAGMELGTAGELRFGAYRGVGEARRKIGDPLLNSFDFDTGGVFAQLRFDTRDAARFPQSGLRGGLRWNLSRPSLGADSAYDTVQADISMIWSRGKNAFELGLDYATTLEADGALQAFFPLGGFLRLSGLERGQLSGPHAGLGRFVWYRRIGDSAGGLFDVPIYFGASLEAGNVWQTRDAIDLSSLQTSGSLFIGMDTYIGPVFLAGGLADSGRRNVYLFIGSPPR